MAIRGHFQGKQARLLDGCAPNVIVKFANLAVVANVADVADVSAVADFAKLSNFADFADVAKGDQQTNRITDYHTRVLDQ